MTSLHAMNYEILKNASDSDWSRISSHPERGELTLFEVVSLGTNHTEGHIAQLKTRLFKTLCLLNTELSIGSVEFSSERILLAWVVTTEHQSLYSI
jgi:hypothetical protein